MPESALVPFYKDFPVSLDQATIDQLQSPQDIADTLHVVVSVGERSVPWIAADLLLLAAGRYDDQTLGMIASQAGVSRSKAINYIRVAKAFPPDKRIPHVSFSHHFQASFADPYDGEQFYSDTRFEWIEKASDDPTIATRDLAAMIRIEKNKTELRLDALPCLFCGESTGEVFEYITYSPLQHTPSDNYDLHPACWAKIRQFIERGNSG